MFNTKKILAIFIIFTSLLNFVPSVIAQSNESGETRIVTNGTVTNSIQVNDALFIGGSFTQVKVNDSNSVERHNLVEADLSSNGITSWNPDPDAPVQDIISYKDQLIISGQFSKINAENHKYFAVADINSKKIQDLHLVFNKPVYALALHSNILYIGGEFDKVNEQQRTHLASYNLETNTLSTWGPDINDNVYEITIDKDTIYIGGSFTQVNGQDRNHIAAFDYETGELTEWKPSVDAVITKIEVQENSIVVTGYVKNGDDIQGKKITVQKSNGEIILDEPQTKKITPMPESIPTKVVIAEIESTTEPTDATVAGLMVDKAKLGFQIPTLSDILTFTIRGFFVISGLAALFFLLLGAFAWVTSGGDEESIASARNKIQAAIIGLLMMVAVLAVVWTLEQVIFNRRLCFGISCPVTIPTLLQPN